MWRCQRCETINKSEKESCSVCRGTKEVKRHSSNKEPQANGRNQQFKWMNPHSNQKENWGNTTSTEAKEVRFEPTWKRRFFPLAVLAGVFILGLGMALFLSRGGETTTNDEELSDVVHQSPVELLIEEDEFLYDEVEEQTLEEEPEVGSESDVKWGNIHIMDAVGEVGEEIIVNISVTSGEEPIGDVSLTISYDSSLLEFVRGTNATAERDNITVSAAGDGEQSSLDYYIVFRGIAEGYSDLDIVNFMTWLIHGSLFYADFNSATVTILPKQSPFDFDIWGEDNTTILGESDIEMPLPPWAGEEMRAHRSERLTSIPREDGMVVIGVSITPRNNQRFREQAEHQLFNLLFSPSVSNRHFQEGVYTDGIVLARGYVEFPNHPGSVTILARYEEYRDNIIEIRINLFEGMDSIEILRAYGFNIDFLRENWPDLFD